MDHLTKHMKMIPHMSISMQNKDLYDNLYIKAAIVAAILIFQYAQWCEGWYHADSESVSFKDIETITKYINHKAGFRPISAGLLDIEQLYLLN